jgi:hypothetical protein
MTHEEVRIYALDVYNRTNLHNSDKYRRNNQRPHSAPKRKGMNGKVAPQIGKVTVHNIMVLSIKDQVINLPIGNKPFSPDYNGIVT